MKKTHNVLVRFEDKEQSTWRKFCDSVKDQDKRIAEATYREWILASFEFKDKILKKVLENRLK